MIFAEAILQDSIPVALITALATVTVPLIAIWGKEKLNKPKKPKQIDSAFGRLEQVADRLQKENDELRVENDKLLDENTTLRIENARLKGNI